MPQRQSHLVDYFINNAWNLSENVYAKLSDLLEAHLLGHKDAWRQQNMPQSFLFLEDDESDPYDETEKDYISDDGIAVLQVRGVLAMHADQVNGFCQPQGRSYESILEQISLAQDNNDVRGLALRLETPGGSACGCQEVFEALVNFDRPTMAYVDGYCFSAGQYTASGCDHIIGSSKAANCGSIGTVMSMWDTSKYHEKQGMQRVVVRAGEFKAVAVPGEPITAATLAE